MKFLFDLDGTVTSKETLPIIADHLKCQEEIVELNKRTIQGNVPFVESFIRRVNILCKFSVSETNSLLELLETGSAYLLYVYGQGIPSLLVTMLK